MRLSDFLNQFCLHPFLFNHFGVFFPVVIVKTPLEHVRDQVTLELRLGHDSSKVKLLTHDGNVLYICTEISAREIIYLTCIVNSLHQISVEGRLWTLSSFEFLNDLCNSRASHFRNQFLCLPLFLLIVIIRFTRREIIFSSVFCS